MKGHLKRAHGASASIKLSKQLVRRLTLTPEMSRTRESRAKPIPEGLRKFFRKVGE